MPPFKAKRVVSRPGRTVTVAKKGYPPPPKQSMKSIAADPVKQKQGQKLEHYIQKDSKSKHPQQATLDIMKHMEKSGSASNHHNARPPPPPPPPGAAPSFNKGPLKKLTTTDRSKMKAVNSNGIEHGKQMLRKGIVPRIAPVPELQRQVPGAAAPPPPPPLPDFKRPANKPIRSESARKNASRGKVTDIATGHSNLAPHTGSSITNATDLRDLMPAMVPQSPVLQRSSTAPTHHSRPTFHQPQPRKAKSSSNIDAQLGLYSSNSGTWRDGGHGAPYHGTPIQQNGRSKSQPPPTSRRPQMPQQRPHPVPDPRIAAQFGGFGQTSYQDPRTGRWVNPDMPAPIPRKAVESGPPKRKYEPYKPIHIYPDPGPDMFDVKRQPTEDPEPKGFWRWMFKRVPKNKHGWSGRIM